MQGLSQKSNRRDPDLKLLEGQSGVLVGLDGYPLLLEIFDSPASLAQHIEPLVSASLLDSSGESDKLVSDSQIERFLEQALSHPVHSNVIYRSRKQLSITTLKITSKMSKFEGTPVHALAINMQHPAFN
jgi:hypothetical protein